MPPAIGRDYCASLDRYELLRPLVSHHMMAVLCTAGPGTSTSPAADRHDDVPHRFRHGQTVLTSCHRGSNGVSLVLVRACGHATKPKGCQSVPSPDRAGLGASLAVPASP